MFNWLLGLFTFAVLFSCAALVIDMIVRTI